MPTFCNRSGNRGTSLVYDSDVAARHDVTNANARIANASNQISALSDLDSLLIRGVEQSSGNLTVNKAYEITATTANYFGTGLIIGNLFVASSALALSSSNKVKEVVGNHLIQTNITYRPLLSNRYNLTTYSQDFSNATWTKTVIILGAFTAAPDSTNTAQKVSGVAAAGRKYIYNSYSLAPYSGNGTLCVASIHAKSAEYTKLYISDLANGKFKALFDISTDQITLTGGVDYVSSGIIECNNGFKRCYIVFKNSGTTPTTTYMPCPDSGATYDNNSATYTGDGVSGMYLWGEQREQSNAISRYQRINAATDYDTVGFPYYARLDGSNDMQSSAFTLNQPCSIYMVFKQNSFTAGDYLCDGVTAGSLQCSQVTSAGNLSIGSGGTSFNNTSKSSIGTYDIVCNVYNGASSSSKINNLTKATGTVGAVNAAGFVLGSKSTPSDYGNLEIKEIIIRNGADSDLMQSAIMNYLYYKHNITY